MVPSWSRAALDGFLRKRLVAMSERDAFGPNLRRLRVQRGVTLEQIAEKTKVSADLWQALEKNDFSRWPAGIYARSYLRSYSALIGADAETTVDDFCRWFPQGDRRAAGLVRGQAAIVGHTDLHWRDDIAAGVDRRTAGAPLPPPAFSVRVASVLAGWLLRLLEGAIDARALREFLKRRNLPAAQRGHHHEV
jgi:transcriptional regulator with XRE-family HTH domain